MTAALWPGRRHRPPEHRRQPGAREPASVRVLSVNRRRLMTKATKSAPATSRNSRSLPARLGRCHCLRLVWRPVRPPGLFLLRAWSCWPFVAPRSGSLPG